MQKWYGSESSLKKHERSEDHRNFGVLDADQLVSTIIKVFKQVGVNLKMCVGQGFDRASVNSVNSIIKEKETSMANYIHLFNQRLNLVAVEML